MKPLRILLIFILLFLVFAGGIAMFSSTLLKKTVTTMGPSILKVPVELEDIGFNPFVGHANIESLTIHNPEGFESPYALQIKEFSVDLAPMSVMGDTIHIHDITVSGVTMISEGLQSDNQRAIFNNLSKGKSDKKQSDRPAAKDSGESSPGKKVIIDHFSFTDSQLIVIVDGEEITKVDFPEVELDQIGHKGSAVTATEAITQIYSAIASETTQVLTVNEEVIKALANAKLKKIGIKDLNDLKDPKKILKDPEAVGNILNNFLKKDD